MQDFPIRLSTFLASVGRLRQRSRATPSGRVAALMAWIAIGCCAAFSSTSYAQQDGQRNESATGNATSSPIGVWQTIDDTTHKPKALIEITRDASGTLSGKVLAGVGPDDNPGKRCTACTDERKDQLIRGMTIMKNLKQNGDLWENGEILDPENGKTYHCQIHVEDNGNKLVVRGYIGVPLLGRSQTWLRDNGTVIK